jgi:hypothetical protein
VGLARWIEVTMMDPERRARLFHRLWLMSVAMVALGYALIARSYWGRLPLP